MNYSRYRRNPLPGVTEREWPSKTIDRAPIWCSVDLRDGNQALMEPMVVEEKIEFWNMLLELGFKDIEVGFPSASQIEFDFLRQLVDRHLIPKGVRVQVLTQCREHLIKRTFEAIEGIDDVIVHIYNNTSPFQREKVYGLNKDEVVELVRSSVSLIKDFAKDFAGHITLEYSPESFTETEPEFALKVCNTVIDTWEPNSKNKIIINLPLTVENNTPNVFADRVEWMSRNLTNRENVVISIHPHNDRGTAVAAAELALMAGAQRIEGTLFGNGERTGNVDLITLACNMLAEGIDPKLELSNLPKIKSAYESLIKINVHERHPYAGEYVFTAFSGGHQDAITKGFKEMEHAADKTWQVPYLAIDPYDVGRIYEPIVRINSQSGKGGVAFIMETYHGFRLPKGMQKEFSDIIQNISEIEGEVNPDRIMWEFKKAYIDMKEPYHFRMAKMEDIPAASVDNFHTIAQITYTDHGEEKTFLSKGNGPIDAVKIGLQTELGRTLKILDYSEHALRSGSNAQAAAYIHLMDAVSGVITYGVGVSSSTTRASIRAIFSALNRMEVSKDDGED